MKNTFLELNNQLKEITGLYLHDIITLMKNDIVIYAKSIKPPMGVEETEEFLANALLILVKDGWTAIPF
ncbi:MAG: hypothetical protein LWW95_11445 [Candidatus Desulfofervidus auxilii]|nr:hypothetical protein [Candidatus Desulfofervidus auxilii]